MILTSVGLKPRSITAQRFKWMWRNSQVEATTFGQKKPCRHSALSWNSSFVLYYLLIFKILPFSRPELSRTRQWESITDGKKEINVFIKQWQVVCLFTATLSTAEAAVESLIHRTQVPKSWTLKSVVGLVALNVAQLKPLQHSSKDCGNCSSKTLSFKTSTSDKSSQILFFPICINAQYDQCLLLVSLQGPTRSWLRPTARWAECAQGWACLLRTLGRCTGSSRRTRPESASGLSPRSRAT